MLRAAPLLLWFCACASTPAPPPLLLAPTDEQLRARQPLLEAAKSLALEPGTEVAHTGEPMPKRRAEQWRVLLEAFAAEAAPLEARDRVLVEVTVRHELQRDAGRYGDVPDDVAVGATSALAALAALRPAAPGPVAEPAAFRWPLDQPTVSSPFGERLHPIVGESRFHAGVDLEASELTPVRAVADGVVRFSGWNGGHGEQLMLEHGKHWASTYSHLHTRLVREGDRVERGAIIGRVGASGLATGPHLHFELHRDGEPVDPLLVVGQARASRGEAP